VGYVCGSIFPVVTFRTRDPFVIHIFGLGSQSIVDWGDACPCLACGHSGDQSYFSFLGSVLFVRFAFSRSRDPGPDRIIGFPTSQPRCLFADAGRECRACDPPHKPVLWVCEESSEGYGSVDRGDIKRSLARVGGEGSRARLRGESKANHPQDWSLSNSTLPNRLPAKL
jgi:hypothetical protein